MRNDDIYAARQSGETLRAIGRRFNLSADRVRQICLKVEHARKRQASDDPWDSLSTRAFNTLHNLEWWDPDWVEHHLDSKGRPSLYRLAQFMAQPKIPHIPNFGKKSIQEVRNWLVSLGYPMPKEIKKKRCPQCGQIISR